MSSCVTQMQSGSWCRLFPAWPRPGGGRHVEHVHQHPGDRFEPRPPHAASLESPAPARAKAEDVPESGPSFPLENKDVPWVLDVAGTQSLRGPRVSPGGGEEEQTQVHTRPRPAQSATSLPSVPPEAPAAWAPALAVRVQLGPPRCGLCALHPGPSTLSRLSSPPSAEGGSLPRLCQATPEVAVLRLEGRNRSSGNRGGDMGARGSRSARSEPCLQFSESPEEQRQVWVNIPVQNLPAISKAACTFNPSFLLSNVCMWARKKSRYSVGPTVKAKVFPFFLQPHSVW